MPKHIEIVRLTNTHVIVEYQPPIVDPELLAELQAYWRERIDRITEEVFYAGQTRFDFYTSRRDERDDRKRASPGTGPAVTFVAQS